MYAHTVRREYGIQTQTVKDHLKNTANACIELGKGVGLPNTSFLVGILHDMGKEKRAFCEYVVKNMEKPGSIPRGTVDHATTGAQYLYKAYYQSDKCTDLMQKLTLELVMVAIMSHHGMIDTIDKGQNYLLERLERADSLTGLTEAQNGLSELLHTLEVNNTIGKATEEIRAIYSKIDQHTSTVEEGTFMLSCLQRLLVSIIIDSDRRDTAHFLTGFYPQVIEDYTKLWDAYLAKLGNTPNTLPNHPNGVYRLSVHGQKGRALKILGQALQQARTQGKKRIIYATAYLNTLERVARDVKDVLQDDDHIIEHHSRIILAKQDMDGYMSPTWDSPVILTTMVRLLNAMFEGDPNDTRRFCKLANSVIVIDEAQEIPVKLLNLFNTMVNFLVYVCNVTIILCSAAQPLFEITTKPLTCDLVDIREPLRVKLTDQTDGGILRMNTNQLADFIESVVDENILVELNTKSAVKKLYKELVSRKTDYTIYQLTANMCSKHRQDVIAEIKSKLNTEKVICVSTQVMESGTDIAFQKAIRSCAGIGSIYQTADRCTEELYIIDSMDEYLTTLPDIAKAKTVMQRNVLAYYTQHKDVLGENWLGSDEAEKLYYDRYYLDRRDDMDYTVKDTTTIYGMLSSTGNSLPLLRCKYKTAGKTFKVIGDDGISVVIPYKDGIEIIKNLDACDDLEQIQKYLQQLIEYSVNIRISKDRIRELLDNEVLYLCHEYVLVLNPKYYDYTGIHIGED